MLGLSIRLRSSAKGITVSYTVRQHKNTRYAKNLLCLTKSAKNPAMKKTPLRNEDNTTLTISLSKELKARIQEAADKDRRKISPWCAIQLEGILDKIAVATYPRKQLKPLPSPSAEQEAK